MSKIIGIDLGTTNSAFAGSLIGATLMTTPSFVKMLEKD